MPAATASTLAIDFGGTATKALLRSDGETQAHCFDSSEFVCSPAGVRTLAQAVGTPLGTLAQVVTTGGTSAALPSRVDDVALRAVNEIEAVGRGGLLACGRGEALVVSVGTGTPMAVARTEATGVAVHHVGGLGLGGGTIMGLGRLLCGVDSFDALSKLAVEGSTEHVDLLVGDIVGRGIGVVPAELTASNFGKAARTGTAFARADVAAGLFTMVGQSIARLAIMLARNAEVSPIVVIGQVIENSYMREVFTNMQALFGGEFVFAESGRYAAAHGALDAVRAAEQGNEGGKEATRR